MEFIEEIPKRVSLQDIADRTGLSKSTVSRALQGKKYISEKTIALVRETAGQMGYRPDTALSALSKYRWNRTENKGSYQIALIRVRGSNALSSTANQSNIEQAMEGVLARAAQEGMTPQIHVLEDSPSPAQLGRMLYHRGIDGLLFAIEGPVYDWDFPFQHFACVTIGYDSQPHSLHRVVPDWFSTVPLARVQCEETGYRKIGFCFFHRNNPLIDDRIQSAMLLSRNLMEENYGPQPKIFYYPHPSSASQHVYENNKIRFLEWYRQEKPEVIIDSNFFAYYWLQEHRIAMPEEVGYVTLLGPARDQDRLITCVSLQRKKMGETAVELLLNLMKLNLLGVPELPFRIVVPCHWRTGMTSRSRKSEPGKE